MQPSCEYHYQLRVKQPPSVRYKGSNPSEPLLAKQPTKVPAEDRPAIAKERAALAIARLRHTLTAFVAVTFASSCSPDQQQGEDDVMVVDIEAQSEADLRQAYEEVVRVTESEILDYRAVLSPDALLLGTANDEQESEEEAEIIIKDAELVTIEATRESLLWTTLAKHAAAPHHRLLKLDPTILGNALRSVEGCFEECGVLLSVLNPIVRPDERVLLMVEGSSREDVEQVCEAISESKPLPQSIQLPLTLAQHAYLAFWRRTGLAAICREHRVICRLSVCRLELYGHNAHRAAYEIKQLLYALLSTSAAACSSAALFGFSFQDRHLLYIDSLASLKEAMAVTMHRPASERDFITGKKDGKLHKIQNETGCLVLIQPVAIEGQDMPMLEISIQQDILKAFNLGEAVELLRGEFPTESRFFIGDEHHRRLIGHGGQAIQAVMKRHGVYVKFESHHRPGDDNVLVRTPAKNRDVLARVKDELLQQAASLQGSAEKTKWTECTVTDKRLFLSSRLSALPVVLLSPSHFAYHPCSLDVQSPECASLEKQDLLASRTKAHTRALEQLGRMITSLTIQELICARERALLFSGLHCQQSGVDAADVLIEPCDGNGQRQAGAISDDSPLKYTPLDLSTAIIRRQAVAESETPFAAELLPLRASVAESIASTTTTGSVDTFSRGKSKVERRKSVTDETFSAFASAVLLPMPNANGLLRSESAVAEPDQAASTVARKMSIPREWRVTDPELHLRRTATMAADSDRQPTSGPAKADLRRLSAPDDRLLAGRRPFPSDKTSTVRSGVIGDGRHRGSQ